ncbi:hypothetical protein FOXG_14392 [Fusarium oxysporum f. sp. lycopersici 4287]|uniref:Uncharacterized protein n=2 Tax=Fusarium oxysporum TaxID=5507 RepID=A0A0J9W074_FUSO4|nr:hypothetical protein FOXG_14392 [Fusarium oxysporum f. sp. lycopersici 4287]KNB16564.1 hypothetical protein FOXG_14392 [Fusarium oxysporum f. sp. lycopersici 4287]
MATGEDVWDSLPKVEQKAIWDETERNFWVNLRSKKDSENKKIEKDFQLSINEVRLKFSDLTGQRSQLKESQSRLARELAKVEAELARTTEECEEKANRLERIEQDYCASTPDEVDDGRMEGIEHHDNEAAETLVDVVDADGNVIGPVEQIEPWNQWVEGIQELEIQRPVKIRRGRRFNARHLTSIYERTEAKGVKWLSCMIQATGEIQAKRCQSCDKNQGAFDDCIIVGGDLFQKCGNCEWNRQGCHGASGDTIDILASRERARRKKQLEEGVQQTPAGRSSETIHPTVEVQPRPEPARQPEPQQVEQEIPVPSRPPSPQPVLQRTLERFPERQPGRQPDRQIEPQPERQHEQQPERRPERSIEPHPVRVTECQAEWTTTRQPERRPEPQTERILVRSNDRFHDVIAARAPERTAEVAPVQIAERPREMPHRPIYGSPHGSPSRPTTAPRSDYAPERMIDPVDSTLPTPIYPQPRPLETPRSVLPSSAPRHSPHDIIHPSTELDGSTKDHRGSVQVHTPRELERMNTTQEYRITPGFTPANIRSRPPSSERGRPTPPSLPIDPSSQPPESPPALLLEEITRENIVLKNDGVVYTYPACVAGVPLVKINEEHPYWEANWPNVKTLIEPQLARWREKHQAAIEAGPKQDKGGSSKYQIGRQVNRGIKILEFHEKGPISPYQLLGKRYIQAGKGGITSYDTLFRLSETISELEKFNLDISPVDWMRQRLHELIQTQGRNFNLPRTIHDFYHDSKLTSLRYKHGFENIGRPSGAMKARLSHGSPSTIPKPPQKRKSMHSVTTTPREDSFVNHSPLPGQISSGYRTPASIPAPAPQPVFSTHLNKKPKYMPPAHYRPDHDEFYFEAWSDTDSCSGGSITKYDWRLAVVLKDVKPAKWGLFRDEIDFHVHIAEIEEMEWSIEALRVHIITKKDVGELAPDGKPRGDVMASFPRARTMRRFLFFCRERGMKMAKKEPWWNEFVDHERRSSRGKDGPVLYAYV